MARAPSRSDGGRGDPRDRELVFGHGRSDGRLPASVSMPMATDLTPPIITAAVVPALTGLTGRRSGGDDTEMV